MEILYSKQVLKCCGSHVNANNLNVCLFLFIFPVEPTVGNRQPIVKQETEQASVPVHTGNVSRHTRPPICDRYPSGICLPYVPALKESALGLDPFIQGLYGQENPG